eukprot:13381020-Alexandrium_andersonii.AAC.1
MSRATSGPVRATSSALFEHTELRESAAPPRQGRAFRGLQRSGGFQALERTGRPPFSRGSDRDP